jgi:catechol 2,3-dioxygenase-like lactoylglutathione lyase family enzyme
MSDSPPLITGTDFITVACQDFDAAVEFYGNVLGLPESKRWGQRPGVEFETGNLTIAVM